MATDVLARAHRGKALEGESRDTGLRSRIRRLLRTEIQFVPHAEFRGETEGGNPFVEASLQQLEGSRGAPAGMPAHLQRMCESSLLTPEQERALFREMNYLKYRANVLRSRLDLEESDLQMVEETESLLLQAQNLRDYILRANMRLVMSITKKFVTPQQSFDELLSEGIHTLIQAVEKFDFARGFRFSTYAYRSISRNAYRCVTKARRERTRFSTDQSNALDQEDTRGSSIARDAAWCQMRKLAGTLMEKLDRREQLVISARYALGAHHEVRTFQELANQLGVSKERVRQLEQRAVHKMREMAADFDLDQVVSAVVD